MTSFRENGRNVHFWAEKANFGPKKGQQGSNVDFGPKRGKFGPKRAQKGRNQIFPGTFTCLFHK